jgi:hypothetical protein
VALHALAASDFRIRSRLLCSRDSCRLADDAQLGFILWMRKTPPTMRCGGVALPFQSPPIMAAVAGLASLGVADTHTEIEREINRQ